MLTEAEVGKAGHLWRGADSSDPSDSSFQQPHVAKVISRPFSFP